MDADPPGCAVILDNVKFKPLTERKRSEENFRQFRNLVQNHGLKVLVEINLSARVCENKVGTIKVNVKQIQLIIITNKFS